MAAERKKDNLREINSSFVKKEEVLAEERARKKRGVLRRVAALTFVFSVIGAIGIMTIYAQEKTLQEKLVEKESLEVKLENLEKQQLQLEQDIENYNDYDYIAEIARRDYFLTKEGEILFKIPKSTSN